MIKPTFLVILILVCALPLTGQVPYGSIELTSKNLKTLQRFLVGDTVVLFYSDPYSSRQPQPYLNEHWVFITTAGERQNLRIPELVGKEKVAVLRNGENLLFYFAEEAKKQTLLKVLTYNTQTKEKTISQCCVIPDNLIVTALDETLTFIYSTPAGELGLMQIDAGRVVRDARYPVPPNTIHVKSGVAFIDEGAFIHPGQAFQPVKIYRSQDQIVITHDKIDYNFNNKKSVTYWTIIDTNSGNVTSMTIPEPGRTLYKSIWHDGKLYRIIKDKGFHIRIFDGEEEVDSFSIPYNVGYADSSGMLRDDAARRVFNNRNVRDVMDNLGKPFIVVQKIDATNIILKVGTQREVSHGHTPILPMASIPGIFVSLAVSSISHAIADESYIHHYFYLKGNISDGFTYTNETSLLEQRIDQYELFDPKTKLDYRYKSYLRTNHHTIAFYMRGRSRRLELVGFR